MPFTVNADRPKVPPRGVCDSAMVSPRALQFLTYLFSTAIMGIHAASTVFAHALHTCIFIHKTGWKVMSDFGELLEAQIPRLRRYARALTRDTVRADDLVQSCLLRALSKAHLWQPGTDLRAWLFTILHNQHVNDVRRAVREGVSIPVDDMAANLTTAPTQVANLRLRDLDRSLAKLPQEQRQVLLLVGVEGMRYEEVAEALDVPVGTVRSRVSRGRDTLRQLMDMETPRLRQAEEGEAAPASRPRAPRRIAVRAA
jgi:RNA polymerase sigma-70 factor (ECF subfamily)